METILLSKPRTNARQTQRSNVQASTAEQYFRITLYNEFLAHVVAELDDRFIDTHPECVGLMAAGNGAAGAAWAAPLFKAIFAYVNFQLPLALTRLYRRSLLTQCMHIKAESQHDAVPAFYFVSLAISFRFVISFRLA